MREEAEKVELVKVYTVVYDEFDEVYLRMEEAVRT